MSESMDDRLVITLSDGAIRNGYLSIPKLQRLFPDECFGEVDQPPQRLFSLRLPDGSSQQTLVLRKYGRIQARLNALFSRENLEAGDQAVLARVADYDYELTFMSANKQSGMSANAVRENGAEPRLNNIELNRILFGPPGTGKTYATIEAALEVLDAAYLRDHHNDRSALKARFDQLVDEGRIRFVTFHQSFSYEDFVEGLRAESDEVSGQLRYEVVDGVFKALCEAASAKVTQQAEAPVELGKRKIWKMSLGNTLGGDTGIYEECVQGGYVLLGYGGGTDFSGCRTRAEVQQRFAESGVTLGGPNDYSLTSVSTFVTKMKPGDLVIVSDGNFKFRAIGEIAGEYAFKPHPDYEADFSQMRPVKWLRQYSPSLPHSELLNGQFSQMTIYELRSPTLVREKLQALLGGAAVTSSRHIFRPGQVYGRDYQVVRATADLLELKKPNGNLLGFSLNLLHELAEAARSGKITLQDIRDKSAIDKIPGTTLEPYLVNGYSNILAPLVEHMLGATADIDKKEAESRTDARVLIIDEINRGNISRIFGELITLIEPSKRAGADETLSVVLPYSKKQFSVPNNVFLIGTMNTTDRSLAGLDIALRRRFSFYEMPPCPDLLNGVTIEESLDVGQLLKLINQRIEVLLDREHCLGHAYFMPLKSEPTLERLALIFRNQVLPLLQEYFFEDWQRIQWVLNDHRKVGVNRFVYQEPSSVQQLFGTDVDLGPNGQTWHVSKEAFDRLEAYLGVIDHQESNRAVSIRREAPHGEFILRELASGSIEIWRAGVQQIPSSPSLRLVAEALGVVQFNNQGNQLNTRALGRLLITRLLEAS